MREGGSDDCGNYNAIELIEELTGAHLQFLVQHVLVIPVVALLVT
jgi:hypothetical protein